MTLQSSGQISSVDINVELGKSGTAQISLNDTDARALAGITGNGTQISFSDFYGKSSRVTFYYYFTTNHSNATISVADSGSPWYTAVANKTDYIIVVSSGVYLWASSTSTYGFNDDGVWPGDTMTIVNNGYIIGCGGAGGRLAGPGGAALNINHPTTITNNGYIAGGGGGGASSGNVPGICGGGGGGAGGGDGAYGTGNITGSTAPGGSGGSIGVTGSDGGYLGVLGSVAAGTGGGAGGGGGVSAARLGIAGGGGGGRILPGVGGNGGTYAPFGPPTPGGSGNSPGTSTNAYQIGGGGGGWGAPGGNNTFYSLTGGTGGNAIKLNGFTVTWATVGTVYGSVS